MAETGKKVEVRFGAFSCSVEGYDNPVEQMREVLLLMQRMIHETPALADHGPGLGEAEVAQIEDALDRRAGHQAAGAPGSVLIQGPEAGRARLAESEDAVTTAEIPPERRPPAGSAPARPDHDLEQQPQATPEAKATAFLNEQRDPANEPGRADQADAATQPEAAVEGISVTQRDQALAEAPPGAADAERAKEIGEAGPLTANGVHPAAAAEMAEAALSADLIDPADDQEADRREADVELPSDEEVEGDSANPAGTPKPAEQAYRLSEPVAPGDTSGGEHWQTGTAQTAERANHLWDEAAQAPAGEFAPSAQAGAEEAGTGEPSDSLNGVDSSPEGSGPGSVPGAEAPEVAFVSEAEPRPQSGTSPFGREAAPDAALFASGDSFFAGSSSGTAVVTESTLVIHRRDDEEKEEPATLRHRTPATQSTLADAASAADESPTLHHLHAVEGDWQENGQAPSGAVADDEVHRRTGAEDLPSAETVEEGPEPSPDQLADQAGEPEDSAGNEPLSARTKASGDEGLRDDSTGRAAPDQAYRPSILRAAAERHAGVAAAPHRPATRVINIFAPPRLSGDPATARGTPAIPVAGALRDAARQPRLFARPGIGQSSRWHAKASQPEPTQEEEPATGNGWRTMNIFAPPHPAAAMQQGPHRITRTAAAVGATGGSDRDTVRDDGVSAAAPQEDEPSGSAPDGPDRRATGGPDGGQRVIRLETRRNGGPRMAGPVGETAHGDRGTGSRAWDDGIDAEDGPGGRAGPNQDRSRFSALLTSLGDQCDPQPAPVQPSQAGGVRVPGPVGPEDLAERAGARSVPDLLAVAAAWLTLVEGKVRFTRREVMETFERLPGDHPRTLEARIKGFGKLVRSSTLILVDDGVFAMPQPERDRFQAMIDD